MYSSDDCLTLRDKSLDARAISVSKTRKIVDTNRILVRVAIASDRFIVYKCFSRTAINSFRSEFSPDRFINVMAILPSSAGKIPSNIRIYHRCL